MFFEPCYPLIRGNVARIRNLTPTYDAISIQFPSFFFYFYALLREKEREKFAFIPNRSRIPFQFQRFKFAESRRNERQPCILRFKLAKFELSPIANINLPPPPPLFRKSDASRGRSFEGIDKHWTRYTGCAKSNARFEL